jgi:dTDP-4-amino-4,6-dideoxy-D-galactose acyltransferase
MNTSLNDLTPLAWDSDFLGYGVARLTANNLTTTHLRMQIAAAHTTSIRLIYLVANPTDDISNDTARQAGAWLADRKVTFVMPLTATTPQPLSSAIVATTTWTPQLESLALQSGEYSRFRLDVRFNPSIYTRLYQQWLRNSLSHELAREVLVFKNSVDNSQAAGLLTLGEKQGRADIGLLAVDIRERGQHIGQRLIAAAQQQASSWGFAELQVVTQLDNLPACSFYKHCGFTPQQVEHIYHLWL